VHRDLKVMSVLRERQAQLELLVNKVRQGMMVQLVLKVPQARWVQSDHRGRKVRLV
jgi:hypothetical protein